MIRNCPSCSVTLNFQAVMKLRTGEIPPETACNKCGRIKRAYKDKMNDVRVTTHYRHAVTINSEQDV